jgi:hypothetical protein
MVLSVDHQHLKSTLIDHRICRVVVGTNFVRVFSQTSPVTIRLAAARLDKTDDAHDRE